MASNTKERRGGARPGSGRRSKYGKTVTTTIRMPVAMREYLQTGEGSIVDNLVRILGRTRGYRDFCDRRVRSKVDNPRP